MINKKYVIKYLIDCQEHIQPLAKLWYEEISQHWTPNASIEKAKEKLIAHLSKDKLPIAYVALHENHPIGMVCLRENDGIRQGITPWLGSLVVQPEYRGSKVGERLINFVKNEAKQLGHPAIYLLAFDQTIPNWYAKLGWMHIGYDELFGHQVSVMSIQL